VHNKNKESFFSLNIQAESPFPFEFLTAASFVAHRPIACQLIGCPFLIFTEITDPRGFPCCWQGAKAD